jgi:hypothetical protein
MAYVQDDPRTLSLIFHSWFKRHQYYEPTLAFVLLRLAQSEVVLESVLFIT